MASEARAEGDRLVAGGEVPRIKFDERGIVGFHWPVAREEVLAVRDVLIPSLVSEVRDTGPPQSPAGAALSSSLVYLVIEALSAYQACVLARHLGKAEIQLAATQQWRMVTASIAGQQPERSPLQRVLVDGPSVGASRLPLRVRRLRWEMAWNGLAGVLPGPYGVDILEITPLVRRHVRHSEGKVRYSPCEKWFGGLASPTNAVPMVVDESTVSRLVEVIRGSFAAGNEELSVPFADYFESWIVEVTSRVAWYVEQLLRSASGLPGHLWTGTGSKVWTRILRHATRLSGGVVTGHDHGFPCQIHNHYRELVELESCDFFMTFTQAGARSLQEVVRDDLLIEGAAPKVIGAPAGNRRLIVGRGVTPGQESRACRGPVRTIMYLSPMISEQTVHLVPLMPGVVLWDWTARLFRKLSEWGYEIIYKPHPEGLQPPRELAELSGVRLENRLFEQVVKDADVVICDMPLTTALGSAIVSGVPMVLIDFGFADWTELCLSSLRERCCLVPANWTTDNRCEIDWDALREAVEGCGELMGTRFQETWLRYGS